MSNRSLALRTTLKTPTNSAPEEKQRKKNEHDKTACESQS
jgi:hypothetical protein